MEKTGRLEEKRRRGGGVGGILLGGNRQCRVVEEGIGTLAEVT